MKKSHNDLPSLPPCLRLCHNDCVLLLIVIHELSRRVCVCVCVQGVMYWRVKHTLLCWPKYRLKALLSLYATVYYKQHNPQKCMCSGYSSPWWSQDAVSHTEATPLTMVTLSLIIYSCDDGLVWTVCASGCKHVYSCYKVLTLEWLSAASAGRRRNCRFWLFSFLACFSLSVWTPWAEPRVR